MQEIAPKTDLLRLSNEESNRITRECLRIALLRLMDKKPFERITITELTQTAGVSRTAFYRNYASKEALGADICKSLADALTEAVQGELYRNAREEWYANAFREIAKSAEFFQIYLNAHLPPEAIFTLESVFPSETPLQHYANVARQGAFVRILTDWFRGGMREKPEQMGRICMQLIPDAFDAVSAAEE